MESEYVRNNMALQVEYAPIGQGRVMATQKLISFQRWFLTWISVPTILLRYLLVLTHIKATPPTSIELVTQMKLAGEKRVEEEKASLDLERQSQIQAHLAAQQASANVTPIQGA